MCRESERLTPFNPQPLTDAEKARLQDISRYNITNHEANRLGMARYIEKRDNGAWDQQNFRDNFGEEA